MPRINAGYHVIPSFLDGFRTKQYYELNNILNLFAEEEQFQMNPYYFF